MVAQHKGKEYQQGRYVSHYNFCDEGDNVVSPGTVTLHDCTLREGEQHAGVSFTREEKMEITRRLTEAGIPRIEVAIVSASEEDREALREITAMRLNSKVFGLCRLLRKDVDLAIECGLKNIGLIVLANDQYLKAYNWTLDQVMQMISETSKYAREKELFVTLMIAEASRMETERFVSLVDAAAKNGYIDSVSAMDTFGVFSPLGVKRFVKEILAKITVPLELHCHNDFGLAVANSIAAIESGVKTIHCSVLGLGERIGNAPTEELVASLEMLYGIKTGVRLEKLRELAEVVSKYSRIPILSTKPVIGSGLNTIVSGLVAAEYIRLTEADKEWEKWLFPFLPHVIGLDAPNIVLGKTSGNANLDWNLSKTGLKLTTEQKKVLLEKVKEISSSEHRLIDPAELAELTKSINS